MWSGPRNISTALMRSWSSRNDTVVVDEPFYACYLAATGKEHPGAAETIAKGELDWRKIVARLTGAIPNGRLIQFQKQMTHHFLPEIDRQWLLQVTNCFLIRDPAEVIASYIKKREDPTLEDLGFVQQLQIFNWLRANTVRGGSGRTGSQPFVIDAKDILLNPERMLRLLCAAVRVPFDPAMLSWQPGLRDTDGPWAKYWYAEVAKSTSFAPYRSKTLSLPERFREIHGRCRHCYDQLYSYRLH